MPFPDVSFTGLDRVQESVPRECVPESCTLQPTWAHVFGVIGLRRARLNSTALAAAEKNVGEQNNEYLSKSQLRVGGGSSYFVRVCIPPVLLTGKF